MTHFGMYTLKWRSSFNLLVLYLVLPINVHSASSAVSESDIDEGELLFAAMVREISARIDYY